MDHAEGFYSLPYFLDILQHELAQEYDGPVRMAEVLQGPIGYGPLSFPRHVVLLRHAVHLPAGEGM